MITINEDKIVEFRMYKFDLEIDKNILVTEKGWSLNSKLDYPLFLHKIYDYRYEVIIGITGERLWLLSDYDFVLTKDILKNVSESSIKKIEERINNAIDNENILPEYNYLLQKEISIINKSNNVNIIGNKNIVNIIKKSNLNSYFKHIIQEIPIGRVSNDSLLVNCSCILPKPKNRTTLEIQYFDNIVNTFGLRDQVRYIGYVNERIDIFIKGILNPICYYYPKINVMLIMDISREENIDWINTVIKNLGLVPRFKPKSFSLTIGCDPEFEITNGKKVMSIPLELSGSSRLRGFIGSDGHGSQLELRTGICDTEEELIDDLKKSFGKISFINMSAVGDKESIGGHIHFGCKINGVVSQLLYTPEFIRLLDRFLGNKFVNLSGMARGHFGIVGDKDNIRNQNWGFEYRTLPAACFQNPKITKIVLKIAKNICEKYYNKQLIKFKRNIDFDDYKNICNLSEEEYKYFVNFYEKYWNKTKGKNIVRFWTLNKGNNKITISFYDIWEKTPQDLFKLYLSDLVVPFDINIILYGIKDEKKICGIQQGSFGIKNHPVGLKYLSEGICFGLPKYFRTNPYREDVELLCKNIRLKLSKLFEQFVDKESCNTKILFPEELYGILDYVPPQFEELRDNRTPQLINMRNVINYSNDSNTEFSISQQNIPHSIVEDIHDYDEEMEDER